MTLPVSRWLLGVAVTGAGLVAPTFAASETVGPRPLNVLFLAIDDLRPAVGVYGDPLAITPNIDRLASRGLVFERAYCQQALCAPSRASIMTGWRPEAFPRISAGEGSRHYREALPDVVTLPQHFKNHGYTTESIGKINHVYPPILDPVSWSVPEQLADIVKRDEYLRPENRVGGFIQPMRKGAATEAIDAPDNAYVDGQAADLAIARLRELKDRPFFLAVGTKRPHLPWTAPQRYWDMHAGRDFSLRPETARSFAADFVESHPWRFSWRRNSGEMRAYTDIRPLQDIEPAKAEELRRGYYASVSYVDVQIGRIIDELDRLQLTDSTIIVLWSDHGYHLGENGLWGKKTNTELDLRVPLIVVAPGHTRPGTRTNALVELVDLYPTLADLAGLPREPELEGTSFLPVLGHPDQAWKSAVFSRYVNAGMVGEAIRTDEYRYIKWTDQDDGRVVDRELYHLSTDPLERDNLVLTDSAKVAELDARLEAGWKSVRSETISDANAFAFKSP